MEIDDEELLVGDLLVLKLGKIPSIILKIYQRKTKILNWKIKGNFLTILEKF